MEVDRPSPRKLSYEQCLELLLDGLGEPVEVTIAPVSDEPIIYAGFRGTLDRARDVPLWAGFADSHEGLFFTLGEDRDSGFVLYPGRFRSAYTDSTEKGWGMSIEQQDVRIDLWFG